MIELFTPSWTFGAYALICAVGWVLVWLIYPETMGLDLEDVGALLKDGWGVKESMERLKALRASESQWSR
jgi:MFS transporter, SP family, solute carrier family 2 (myo-inositol transporter), member 13